MPNWTKLDLNKAGGMPPEKTMVNLRYRSIPIATIVYDIGMFRAYGKQLEWLGKNTVCKAKDLFSARKDIFWCPVPEFDGEVSSDG